MTPTASRWYRILPLALFFALLLVLVKAESGPVRTIRAAGSTLYGVAPCGNNTCTVGEFGLYTIDTSTGAGTFVGGLELDVLNVSAIEMNLTSGVLYGTGAIEVVDNTGGFTRLIYLFTINTATGQATLLSGDTGLDQRDGNVTDLSFRNSNNLLFAHFRNRNDSDGELYTIDTSTGAATLKGATGLDQKGNSIAHSPTDTLYYFGDENDGELYTLSETTGAPTDTGTALDFTGVEPTDCDFVMSALDYNPDTGVLFGVMGASFERGGGDNCLVTVNTTSGVVTEIGATVPALEAIAFSPGAAVGSPTPTPTATRTNTPGPSSTPSATPTRTNTPNPTVVISNQPNNVGGAGAALAGALGASADRRATAAAGAVAVAPPILPPSTGGGGLKAP